MSPIIEKLMALALMLALGTAPLQGLQAAVPAPGGLDSNMHEMASAQNGAMPVDTVIHECSKQNGHQDEGCCCEQACTYGHCSACFTALYSEISDLVTASTAPELARLASAPVGWLPYPSFRPPRL